MSVTVLLVDDEPDILEMLKYNLEKSGYRVLTATNGAAALKIASSKPDLIVLDVMMPKMNGWEVCRALRKGELTSNIPVIFLTARHDDADEVNGLELGAADYIRKPVRIQTFLARVKRALRSKALEVPAREEERLSVGDLEIELQNYVVKIRGREIHFPKKEFEVLVFLARHPERVISREKLLNEVWGHEVFVVDRTVDVHIRKIREKLGTLADHIETVKGVGYRFKKES